MVRLFRRKTRASLVWRLNSVEVTRSRESLANMPYHSASMATRTQHMCVYRMHLQVCEST